MPVTPKTRLRLLVDKRQVKCAEAKRVERCVFKYARAVAVDNGDEAFAGNQQFASSLLLRY